MTIKKIKIGTYPTFYGDNNVSFAFEKGEMVFELEVGCDTYRHKSILTLENVLELKNQIENALIAHDKFMKEYSNA